jgi:hypothetical protein
VGDSDGTPCLFAAALLSGGPAWAAEQNAAIHHKKDRIFGI